MDVQLRPGLWVRWQPRRRALLIWGHGLVEPIEVKLGILAAFHVSMNAIVGAMVAYRVRDERLAEAEEARVLKQDRERVNRKEKARRLRTRGGRGRRENGRRDG